MIPKKSVATKLATRRTRYANGSRRATRKERSVRTASCLVKEVVDDVLVGVAVTSFSDFSSTPYGAPPLRSAHLPSVFLTVEAEVKSLFTRSRTNSATFVPSLGGEPMEERYSLIFEALPK